MKLWVGEVGGEVLVYDPSIQLADCPHIFLWSTISFEMCQYNAAVTRQNIKRLKNTNALEVHTTSYMEWKFAHGVAWLNNVVGYYASRRSRELEQEIERNARDLERIEQQRVANLTPEQRHKERLEQLGIKYLGIRPAIRTTFHRVTHCYSCTQPLDNSVDSECIACGWILCTCGACGCGCQLV